MWICTEHNRIIYTHINYKHCEYYIMIFRCCVPFGFQCRSSSKKCTAATRWVAAKRRVVRRRVPPKRRKVRWSVLTDRPWFGGLQKHGQVSNTPPKKLKWWMSPLKFWPSLKRRMFIHRTQSSQLSIFRGICRCFSGGGWWKHATKKWVTLKPKGWSFWTSAVFGSQKTT